MAEWIEDKLEVVRMQAKGETYHLNKPFRATSSSYRSTTGLECWNVWIWLHEHAPVALVCKSGWY